MYHAIYLYNRTISHVINNRTPYEILLSRPPTVYYQITFGCKAYSHIHKVYRNSKLFDYTERGVYLVIDDRLYRFYVPRVKGFVQTKHVTFNE